MSPFEDIFLQLARGGFRITSPRDDEYNCIAWAAGDTTDWWWPGQNPELEYWPSQIPRELTLAAFEAVFASLGYVSCPSDALEPGFERIGLYAKSTGEPTHAARQLSHGRWTSKLGAMEDIEHDLRDLEGEVYGTVVRIMRRPLAQPAQTNVG